MTTRLDDALVAAMVMLRQEPAPDDHIADALEHLATIRDIIEGRIWRQGPISPGRPTTDAGMSLAISVNAAQMRREIDESKEK